MSAPFRLAGLNSLVPQQQQNDILYDEELSKQLELWTNVDFRFDEPTAFPQQDAIASSSTSAPAIDEFDWSRIVPQEWAPSTMDASLLAAVESLPSIPAQNDQTPSSFVASTPATAETPGHLSSNRDRVVDEEDKRRRNTAASARFRAKKKEREKALEEKSRDLEARTQSLEKEVASLRKENEWLKTLVVSSGAIPNGSVVAGVKREVEAEVEKSQKRVRA